METDLNLFKQRNDHAFIFQHNDNDVLELINSHQLKISVRGGVFFTFRKINDNHWNGCQNTWWRISSTPHLSTQLVQHVTCLCIGPVYEGRSTRMRPKSARLKQGQSELFYFTGVEKLRDVEK